MIAWLLRLILFLLTFAFLRALLIRLFGTRNRGAASPGRNSPHTPKQRTGKMIQDPQCGMYVASNLAVQEERQGRMFYFCSEECRTEFFAQVPKGKPAKRAKLTLRSSASKTSRREAENGQSSNPKN